MSRLANCFGIAVILFFVILGVCVGLRIDQNTMALLGGAALGVLVTAPIVSIITFIAVRSRASTQCAEPPAWAAPMPHPHYVLQSPAHYGQVQPQSPTMFTPVPTPPAVQPFSLPPRRKFYLIGESGDTSEIEPDAAPTTFPS